MIAWFVQGEMAVWWSEHRCKFTCCDNLAFDRVLAQWLLSLTFRTAVKNFLLIFILLKTKFCLLRRSIFDVGSPTVALSLTETACLIALVGHTRREIITIRYVTKHITWCVRVVQWRHNWSFPFRLSITPFNL